jgi:hypothetical protein
LNATAGSEEDEDGDEVEGEEVSRISQVARFHGDLGCGVAFRVLFVIL